MGAAYGWLVQKLEYDRAELQLTLSTRAGQNGEWRQSLAKLVLYNHKFLQPRWAKSINYCTSTPF